MLHLKRESRKYFDKLRKYKIIIDDSEVGIIGDDKIFTYNLDAGHHTIYLKIDWCKSNKLEFDVVENEFLEFECGSLNGIKIYTVLPGFKKCHLLSCLRSCFSNSSKRI